MGRRALGSSANPYQDRRYCRGRAIARSKGAKRDYNSVWNLMSKLRIWQAVSGDLRKVGIRLGIG
jgi:hypothetical protein